MPCLNPNPAQRPLINQVIEALEKLIRSVVSMAQTKLSPEMQAQCKEGRSSECVKVTM